jgi:hypothetical protein
MLLEANRWRGFDWWNRSIANDRDVFTYGPARTASDWLSGDTSREPLNECVHVLFQEANPKVRF